MSMHVDIDVDLADARHRVFAKNSTDRLLSRLRQCHDYSVKPPKDWKPRKKEAPAPVDDKPIWFSIESDNPLPTIENIQNVVAEHYGITRHDILSPRRAEKYTTPRHIAVYLSKKLTLHSFPALGRKFGGRDHSTLIHSVHKVEKQIESDPAFGAKIEAIKSTFGVIA